MATEMVTKEKRKFFTKLIDLITKLRHETPVELHLTKFNSTNTQGISDYNHTQTELASLYIRTNVSTN
jgi:hypothetical protein